MDDRKVFVVKLIQDALVYAQTGGSFTDYIASSLNRKLNDYEVYVKAIAVAEVEDKHSKLIAFEKEKSFKEGRRSVNEQGYDTGYKDGYDAGIKYSESMKNWDNFKIGDMK